MWKLLQNALHKIFSYEGQVAAKFQYLCISLLLFGFVTLN
jgi:hypothetical protein